MINRSLLLLALVASPATLAASDHNPTAVLQQARVLSAAGNQSGALQLLNSALAAFRGPRTDADAAAIHLEAARLAAGQDDRAEAGTHLKAFHRLSGVFRPAPVLRAKLEREAARIAIRIGDPKSAKQYLKLALPVLAAADLAAAAEAANALGLIHLDLEEYDQAVRAFKWSLQLISNAHIEGDTKVILLVNLTSAQIEEARLDDARATIQQAKEAAGQDSRLQHAVAVANAEILLHDSDILAAEALLKETVRSAESSDPSLPHALFLLATTYFNAGFMPEAIRTGLDAAEAYRSSAGSRSSGLARSYHLLGSAYGGLHSNGRAMQYFVQAASIERDIFGPLSLQTQSTELERAWLDIQDGNLQAAQDRATGALSALDRAAISDARATGIANIVIGIVAEKRHSDDEAIARYRNGQTLIASARGPMSPDLGFSLVRAGRLLTKLRRFDEAKAALDRAVEIYHHAGSSRTSRLADALMALSDLKQARGDRRGALEQSRRVYAMLQEQSASSSDDENMGDQQMRGRRELFALHAVHVLSLDDSTGGVEEAFEATQFALVSRAGQALRLAADRRAQQGDEFGDLLKRRELDTASIIQAEEALQAQLLRTKPEQHDYRERLHTAIGAANERLQTTNAALASKFPAFATLLHPQPASIQNVQGALRPQEVLLVPVSGEGSTLVWVVTPHSAQSFVAPLDQQQIDALVRRIRKGVDFEAVPQGDPMPPFDREAAAELYRTLISPLADQIPAAATIVVVTDGSLQTIPFSLLLDPAGAWLVRSHAVDVYPAVSALVAARSHAAPSRARKQFLGLGDPLFRQDVAGPSLNGSDISEVQRGLARLPPLPETATELSTMAALFSADSVTVLTGQRATRQTLVNDEPGDYRVLAFATHALMAGDLPGLLEPAIVVTPDASGLPWNGDGSDRNGLLMAFDILLLHLDADLARLIHRHGRDSLAGVA